MNNCCKNDKVEKCFDNRAGYNGRYFTDYRSNTVAWACDLNKFNNNNNKSQLKDFKDYLIKTPDNWERNACKLDNVKLNNNNIPVPFNKNDDFQNI